MSDNLYKLFTDQFDTNLRLKLQQHGSVLSNTVASGVHVGKMASPVQYEGPVRMNQVVNRFAPIVRTDSDYTRYWVFPKDRDLAQMIDTFDKLKTIVDPQSPKVANAANAAGREWDDEIILAATRNSKIGRDAAGLSDESFDTTNFRVADTFGSTAASGLTVAKMIEAKRILRHYHALDGGGDGPMEVTLVIGSKQESDLLNQVQVVSSEFNDKPVLVDGNVTRFLGMNIKVMERLPTYTTNTRGVLAYLKQGLYLGKWMDMTNEVSKRTDLSGHPYQLYTMTSFGATRLEPGRLIQIACLDSTGADITP